MWKSIEQPPQEGTDEGYYWLWDSKDQIARLYYISPDMWPIIDLDFTHWMYDGESPEPPEGP